MTKPPARAARKWGPKTALVVWLVGVTLVSASLLARHLALPPSVHPQAELGFNGLGAKPSSSWRMVHVLYAKCRCSRRIVDHLVARKRPSDLVESVIWVGQNQELEARLQSAGFPLVRATPEELRSRFGVEAAPSLGIVDPAGRLRYLGGYTTRKQASEVHDLEFLGALKSERSLSELPIFGCAVSDRLRSLINPLALP